MIFMKYICVSCVLLIAVDHVCLVNKESQNDSSTLQDGTLAGVCTLHSSSALVLIYYYF